MLAPHPAPLDRPATGWTGCPLAAVLLVAGCAQDGLAPRIPDLDAPQYDLAVMPDLAVPPDLATPVDYAWTPPPPAGVSVQMIGTWRSCSGTWRFDKDNTHRLVSHSSGCVSTGTWTIRPGDLLDLTYDESPCSKATKTDDIQVVQSKVGMSLVYPNGRVSNFAADSVPHRRWRVTSPHDGRMEASILRTVSDPGGGYNQACYWSEDGKCGGVLSCGGQAPMWELANGLFTGAWNCTGSCPCGATFSGKGDEKRVEGTFFGINCGGSWMSTFTAESIADD